MKRLVVLGVFLFLIYNISAECTSGQININTASSGELDKLTGIGPAYAANIISTRPFSSVDDLIRVSGIAEVTLQKIKTQGLACVSGEVVNNGSANESDEQNISDDRISANNSNRTEKTFEKENNTPLLITSNAVAGTPKEIQKENTTPVIIYASNTKDIKSENDGKDNAKNQYITYGLIGFSGLILGLFGFKFLSEWNKKRKNEFE